jgi:hypothetical protein
MPLPPSRDGGKGIPPYGKFNCTGAAQDDYRKIFSIIDNHYQSELKRKGSKLAERSTPTE